MSFVNLIVMMTLTYYIVYIIRIIMFKNERLNILRTNNKLNYLRAVPKKTIDEQRVFINTKFPKRQKRKWSFKIIINMIRNILLFILLYMLVFLSINYIFNRFNIEIPWWGALLFIVLFPLSINWVLGKLNLQVNDLTSLVWVKRNKR